MNKKELTQRRKDAKEKQDEERDRNMGDRIMTNEGVAFCSKTAGGRREKADPAFNSAFSNVAPTGARFDSPGRQPWEAKSTRRKPQRGEIPAGEILGRARESRPVGAVLIYVKRDPRADAPWAIESRPFGAHARLRRKRRTGRKRVRVFTTGCRGQSLGFSTAAGSRASHFSVSLFCN
jgi:hypothetical protein